MLRTQYMHSIGLLNIQFWPNPVKKKTRSITIRSSLYIISDEFHLLYWLYEGNFKCFFCNCNLLRFGRVVCGQTYSSRNTMKTATVETISTGLNFIFTLDFTLYTKVFNQHCWLHPMRKRAPALLSVGGKPSSRRGCIILVHTTLHMISISTEYLQNSQRGKVTLLH